MSLLTTRGRYCISQRMNTFHLSDILENLPQVKISGSQHLSQKLAENSDKQVGEDPTEGHCWNLIQLPQQTVLLRSHTSTLEASINRAHSSARVCIPVFGSDYHVISFVFSVNKT